MGNRSYYGILGSGDINKKIVTDGLLDVNDDDVTFLIHARRKPQGAVEVVYDFLADNEARFVAYTRVDDNAPKALLSMANGVNTIDDPTKSIIEALAKNNGTLLLLWNEDNPEESERIAIAASDAGVEMKDLSDGLAPIVVEGSNPVQAMDDEEDLPIAPKPEKVEKNLTAFSRDELMNMNIGVLRRQAKAIGLENIGRIPKEEIVEMIIGANNEPNTEPVVASDVHVSQEPQAMVIYMENGSYMTVQVPLKEIQKLLS
jgi:hypothetical protein